MKLILDSKPQKHVSLDTVAEFEHTILANNSIVEATIQSNWFIPKISFLTWWKINKHSGWKQSTQSNFRNNIFFAKNSHFFSILMGMNFEKCFPYFLLSSQKSIYLFDAWPNQHALIKRFVDYSNLSHVFISSSQAAETLQSISGKSIFYWVPEGINPESYRQYTYENKDIDVLSMGRRYDEYHELIVTVLEMNGKTYFYEKSKGVIIFPTRESFIEGLARTKISICFPSSMTHPERSGNIETMTIRYLQSMVSKCLILGHAPKEMIDLFGYNPVVEIDMQDSARQIISILDRFEEYIPLIERNFNLVIEEHTWHRRWQKIAGVLNLPN
jgi:hypothetical protein